MPRRILRNTAHTIPFSLEPDGTGTDADGNVTIAIVDAAGDTILAATNMTNAASPAGYYTYTLAPQSSLNRLTVTFAGTLSGTAFSFTDTIEVVGAHLFAESELRAYYGGQFANTTAFTDAMIAEARDRISDEFARICGVSFVPRYERQRLAGTGSRDLWVKWPKVTAIQAATIGGTAQTASDIVPDPVLPVLHHTTGVWTAATVSSPLNVYVDYEHGHAAVPGDVKRAALMLCRHQLQPDSKGGGLGDAAITVTDQFGNMNLLDDGSGSAYGLRFVRDTLMGYSLQPRGFM